MNFTFSDFQIFEVPDFWILGCSDFQVFRFSDSLHFKFGIVRFSGFRNSRFSNVLVFLIFKNSDFQIFWFWDLGYSDFRIRIGSFPPLPPFQCWRIIKYSRSLLVSVLQTQQHWAWACKGVGKMLTPIHGINPRYSAFQHDGARNRSDQLAKYHSA